MPRILAKNVSDYGYYHLSLQSGTGCVTIPAGRTLELKGDAIKPLKQLATVFGILAVVFFGLSFQCRKRRDILLINLISRIFYILQYLLLGAFEGAIFDLIGALAALPAKAKETGFVRKWRIFILGGIFTLAILAGVTTYRSLWSLLPFAGVCLEIAALWMNREKQIRVVSLLAQPFWLSYNIYSAAYGSAAGNVFATVSIVLALVRFSMRKKARDGVDGRSKTVI